MQPQLVIEQTGLRCQLFSDRILCKYYNICLLDFYCGLSLLDAILILNVV